MTERSLKVYAAMWRAFSGWLQRENLEWNDVDMYVVRRFLAGPVPTVANRRRPLSPNVMSNYHRQRYWRLLHGVYGEAVRRGWTAVNPAGELSEQERPHISAASRVSKILPPGLLALLRDPQLLCRLLPLREEQDWKTVRDRAIIAVLAHAGLTASEVTGLRGQDLRHECTHGEQSDSADGEAPTDEDTASGYWVDVAKSGDFLGRSLALPVAAMRSIEPWLDLRRRILDERSGGLVAGAQHYLYMGSPLFLSQKGLRMDGPLPSMEPTSLYTVLKQAFSGLRNVPEAAVLLQGEAKVSPGAAIIRNSVMRHWIDTVGVHETLLRSGLTREQSLRHLPAPPIINKA